MTNSISATQSHRGASLSLDVLKATSSLDLSCGGQMYNCNVSHHSWSVSVGAGAKQPVTSSLWPKIHTHLWPLSHHIVIGLKSQPNTVHLAVWWSADKKPLLHPWPAGQLMPSGQWWPPPVAGSCTGGGRGGGGTAKGLFPGSPPPLGLTSGEHLRRSDEFTPDPFDPIHELPLYMDCVLRADTHDHHQVGNLA